MLIGWVKTEQDAPEHVLTYEHRTFLLDREHISPAFIVEMTRLERLEFADGMDRQRVQTLVGTAR